MKKVVTQGYVHHIEKVNDDTFLAGKALGYIELINKKDFSCLSHLKLHGVYDIS